MSDDKDVSNVLQACWGQSQSLSKLVDYSEDAIVSKTIIDKKVGTITLFAFDEGQKLSEHRAPFDAVVQVIDGKGCVTISGEKKEVCTGEIIIMPADIPHAVDALEKFKMLLIMIRA